MASVCKGWLVMCLLVGASCAFCAESNPAPDGDAAQGLSDVSTVVLPQFYEIFESGDKQLESEPETVTTKGAFGPKDAGGSKIVKYKFTSHLAPATLVDKALAWLARHQEADGHWDSQKWEAKSKTDIGITSLGLLAFLGAGHTEKIGKYASNVSAAVRYLISKQADNGLISDASDEPEQDILGVPHAIAGCALAEAAGMARIPVTIAAAQKAVDYSMQHMAGAKGWGVKPKSDGDMIVTTWFIMQMKSAKCAALKMPPEVFVDGNKFLDSYQVTEAKTGLTVYAMTPGGLADQVATMLACFARYLTGGRKEQLQPAVEWAVAKGGVPQWDLKAENVDFCHWYFGALITFHQGGTTWRDWDLAMKPTLIKNQQTTGDANGSWNPVGKHAAVLGRAGVTALAALCSEIYYCYELNR